MTPWWGGGKDIAEEAGMTPSASGNDTVERA
jgi:hypothetical protein